MASFELKGIFERLKRRQEMAFPEAASDEQVSGFEREHGVTLPEGYKDWLSLTDGGEVFLPAGIQFYGVAHKPMIDVDDDDRPDDSYVVIGALASGDPILFERGSERISIYNHEADRIEEDESYPDFLSFMMDLDGILGIGG